jgi:S1-C subfamily serine protease
LSEHLPPSDGGWDDPRWADPQTRAHVEPPPVVWTWGRERAEAAPPAPARPRFKPWLAALLGLAVGAALGVPAGLAERPQQDRGTAITQTPLAPTGSNGQNGLSPDDVAAQVDRSIVDITSRIDVQSATAAGTGMAVDARGDILTNNHVIEGANRIRVTAVTTGRTYDAQVLGTDPTEDVAVIRVVGAAELVAISPADTSRVAVGDPVVALGNAGGRGGTPAIATGFVTALDQQITASDSGGHNPQHLSGLIETDAAIRPGDSGGPLADMRAQVLGMDTAASVGNSFGTSGTTGRGFAIPISHALSIARQILAGKGSATVHIGARGMIGVQVSALSTGRGAVVQAVTSGSPAARAGIHPGDTILAVDGTSVTPDSLGRLIKAHGAGERVTLTWQSADGSRHTARMTLIAGPPD